MKFASKNEFENGKNKENFNNLARNFLDSLCVWWWTNTDHDQWFSHSQFRGIGNRNSNFLQCNWGRLSQFSFSHRCLTVSFMFVIRICFAITVFFSSFFWILLFLVCRVDVWCEIWSLVWMCSKQQKYIIKITNKKSLKINYKESKKQCNKNDEKYTHVWNNKEKHVIKLKPGTGFSLCIYTHSRLTNTNANTLYVNVTPKQHKEKSKHRNRTEKKTKKPLLFSFSLYYFYWTHSTVFLFV